MPEPLNLPPTVHDQALAVFGQALNIVKPPAEPKPRKYDYLNSTLRFLALNAVETMRWPVGSRGRDYADAWVSQASREVMYEF